MINIFTYQQNKKIEKNGVKKIDKSACSTVAKWKQVVKYDTHIYKSKKLANKEIKNHTIYDNCFQFEQDLKFYKLGERMINSFRRSDRKLSKAEFETNFNNNRVMRNFRISINDWDWKKIIEDVLDPDEQRNMIINLYKNITDDMVKFLEKENRYNHKNERISNQIDIVKAEVHFDQTVPHLHLHLSNLYKKERIINGKKYEVFTSNTDLTDWIKIERNFQKRNNLVIKKENEKDKYINQNDFFYKYVFNSKLANERYKELDSFHISKTLNKTLKQDYEKTKQKNNYDTKKRVAKEIAIDNAKKHLKNLGIDYDKNSDINVLKKFNNVIYYNLHQSLAQKVLKSQTKELSNEEFKKLIKQEIEEQRKNNFKELETKTIELNNIQKDFVKVELGNIFPELKEIENEFNFDLNLWNHKDIIVENNETKKLEQALNQNKFENWSEENKLEIFLEKRTRLFEKEKINNNTLKLTNEEFGLKNEYYLTQENNNKNISTFNQMLFSNDLDINRILEQNLDNKLELNNNLNLDNSVEQEEHILNYNYSKHK